MKKLLSCALILAGGRSTRMGTDKALKRIEDKPLLYKLAEGLLDIADRVIIAAGEPSREQVYRDALAELGRDKLISFVFDGDCWGSGPLAGLAAGMAASDEGYLFVIACDMPDVSKPYVQQLLAAAAGEEEFDVIHAPNQPFHALYHTRISAHIRSALRREDYRVMKLFEGLRTLEVEPGNRADESFINLNTPKEYQRYIQHRGGDLQNDEESL